MAAGGCLHEKKSQSENDFRAGRLPTGPKVQPENAEMLALIGGPAGPQRNQLLEEVAEREGFEPPIRLPVCRISSAVHSTTLPPLRNLKRRAAQNGAVYL